MNPLYREGLYEQYSQTTRKSLRRVDESAINYELIEDLLLYIEALEPDRRAAAAALGAPGPEHKGGVLIFLPGIGEITSLADRLTSAHAFTRQHRLNVVAACPQRLDGVGAESALDLESIWVPLVMQPRGRRSVCDIHAVLHHIEEELHVGRDDFAPAWTPRQ